MTRDRPTPIVRAGMLLLAAFVGVLIGLGVVPETQWSPPLTVGVAATVAVIATWWATR